MLKQPRNTNTKVKITLRCLDAPHENRTLPRISIYLKYFWLIPSILYPHQELLILHF